MHHIKASFLIPLWQMYKLHNNITMKFGNLRRVLYTRSWKFYSTILSKMLLVTITNIDSKCLVIVTINWNKFCPCESLCVKDPKYVSEIPKQWKILIHRWNNLNWPTIHFCRRYMRRKLDTNKESTGKGAADPAPYAEIGNELLIW